MKARIISMIALLALASAAVLSVSGCGDKNAKKQPLLEHSYKEYMKKKEEGD